MTAAAVAFEDATTLRGEIAVNGIREIRRLQGGDVSANVGEIRMNATGFLNGIGAGGRSVLLPFWFFYWHTRRFCFRIIRRLRRMPPR